MKIPLPLAGAQQHKEPRVVGIDLGTTNSLVGYMRDGEPVVIPDPVGDPLLPSIDSEPLAIERRYGDADADAVLAAFREARARTVATIGELDDAQLARTAEFEGYGPLTLRSLVHYLCSHDQQHLSGLQWLLGKIDSERVRRSRW